jgi:hypothetical protein
MIQDARFEVVTDDVLLFGKTALPKGIYDGAAEWWEIRLGIGVKRQMARALINLDRSFLEQLGEKITPNLTRVDFDLIKYVKSGDIRVVN